MRVVIGAAFGDEGKGLMTDYFAKPGGLVVRFNGGGQAGHTVQRPSGYRHVFKHFGSGTLKGAATLLGREFIINPYIFTDEGVELMDSGVTPGEYLIDYCCRVTTPFDMMVNQMIEESRGDARHGSCGVGINETVKRHAAGFRLNARHLTFSEDDLRGLLHFIRDKWLPTRLAQLGIRLTPEWRARAYNDRMLDEYIYIARLMMGPCSLVEDSMITENPNLCESHLDMIVFEGAQGLLLDQNNDEYFPHLTPSNTGLQNVMDIIGPEAEIEAVYVTRAYSTRHGAGPFKEVEGLSYPDATNVPNMWQKSLRFGYLDVNLLADTIKKDLRFAGPNVTPSIAVTCLDQVGDQVVYGYEGELFQGHPESLLHMIEIATGIPVRYTSYGPTREDVRKVSEMAL